MQLLHREGTKEEKAHRWYRVAFIAAIIVFILLAPEVNNGKYMDPTIKDGQALVTTKTSFTKNRGMPDRGQLVILKKPFSQEAGADDNIITRVIAIPGDTVEITEGKVLVN
ncbi:MAG: signal peptidase I, partial [Firmicutes bacterium]|nr:signal peptidase I [Bacillota bacterium]